MATCVLSGTFLDPSSAAISGATITFSIESPVLDAGGLNLLAPRAITTTTATDGTWSLTISRGTSGTLALDCPPDSLNSTRRYTFAMQIPLAATATFSSAWADSQNTSYTAPLTFAQISGQLATAQLPSIASANLWVGNGSSVATAVAITGDITLSNAGVTAVATVGGSTAANVHAAELLANAATAANTASTILKRDGSGQVAATTFTGALAGNATTATSATTASSATTATTATAPAAGSAHGAITLDGSGNFQSVAPGAVTGYLRSNGTDFVRSTIQAGDVPTLNQNTTGTAANVTDSSNSTLTTLSALTSASALATVGTITSGTWSGTTIALNKGGTGQTTKAPAFNALSPNTTKGDITTHDGTNSVRQGIGTDGQVLVGDSAQTNGLKWATLQQGAKNYITYGNFENNATTGWTATGCATVTNGLPVTVGSGAAAFSSSNGGRTKGANTSSPAIDSSSAIAGTYSLNLATTAAGTIGDGYISSAYTIDAADQAKVLAWKLYYKVASGTPVMGGTSANTYAVAIYDVANNAWLGTTGAFNFVQSTGVGIAQGTVQTASNSTSLQIFVYSPVAPTGASSLLLDDFYLGPQSLAFGPAMTDWVSYTPTFTGFGTATSINFWSRRVGDSLEVQGYFTTGTVAGSTAAITLGYNGGNSNVTADITKVSNGQFIGKAAVNTSSTTIFDWSVLCAGATSTVNIGIQTSTASQLTAATGSGGSVSNQVAAVFFRIPIVGWSSNTVMSNDTDTRVIAMQANASSTSITGSLADIAWTTTVNDTAGAFGGTTYTVPVTGYYHVNAKIRSTATYAANNSVTIAILRNGSSVSQKVESVGSSSQTIMNPMTDWVGLCNAGDTIKIQYADTGTSPTIVASVNYNTFGIFRLSGPAAIAATETVAMKYTDTSGANVTSSAAVYKYLTKSFDTHNAYSTSTGLYTVPVSGKYQVTGGLQFGSQSPSTTQAYRLHVAYNGTIDASTVLYGNGASIAPAIQVSDLIQCNAGDTIQVQVRNDVGTVAASTNTGFNFISITRVGN